MCGITGLVAFQNLSPIKEMTRILQHRGPNDEGLWIDSSSNIAFGHRRLSIIDLSERGHQPMTSSCGRFVIAYNGEVYNANLLRQNLEILGRKFKGNSDTEVMVEACAEWGVQEASARFIGMFAFALWDKKEKLLYLVRDRLGKKPLYWGKWGKELAFASELKSFHEHPDIKPRLNLCEKAFFAYFTYNYIPFPLSIYENIFKVEPGSILIWNHHGEITTQKFWDAHAMAKEGISQRAREGQKNEKEKIKELDQLLREAVQCRMISDVPLGAFLSGGVDSSTVVALMQAQNASPIKTFSIGLAEKDYNEADQARKVAEFLNTDHHELILEAKDIFHLIPLLPQFYDEPFADASQVPTYFVSQLAKEKVTVALSGDGGDELFAGYNRHQFGPVLWNQLSRFPLGLRKGLAKALLSFSPQTLDTFLSFTPLHYRQFGEKVHKLAKSLKTSSADTFYQGLLSPWNEGEKALLFQKDFLINASKPENQDHLPPCAFPNFLDRMQFWDLITYLPEDILTKVDRVSMAVGLEVRGPLLDHRVVEFAWSLPQEMKIKERESKWILRQVLYQYIPKELIERPKMGFALPLDHWLRGPLKDWASDLLSPESLQKEGVFNSQFISKIWNEHQQGKKNWQYALWAVLMWEGWRKRWQG